MKSVELYDTTLRDGNQGEGVAFSVEDKIRIVHELDALGIQYIEGGYPGSNPKDIEFFQRIKDHELEVGQVVPFGSTHRPSLTTDEDPGLNALLDTGLPTATIFGKSWALHAEAVLRISCDENLALIENSVRFLTEHGRQVIYDAEHFFDGFKADPEYALETLRAAEAGGATRLILCDTNGGTLPLELHEIVKQILAAVETPVGIHAHNDAGVAVANTLLAVQAGAIQVQGTFNGYGERCGNANLSTVIPNLKLKLGIACISDEQLKRLTEVSRLISELANLAHDERQAYVGHAAFAHKGGMHIDAVRKERRTFEHIDPELVGNEQRILISEQAGRSAIQMKLEKELPGLEKNSEEALLIFEALKEAEMQGYQYEGAEASFRLLTRKALNQHKPLFDLLGFRVIIEKFRDHSMRSEATIKVREPNGVIEHTASDGEGPVNALDRALRKALEKFYPTLQAVRLTDFKVRVLDSRGGTAAKVRVLLEASDGEETWGTVGVSENIIQACWEALADSLQYKLFQEQNGFSSHVAR